MRILITGGAGYLGSKLTETLLSQGHDVVVYDNLFFGSVGVIPFLDNNTKKKLLRNQEFFVYFCAVK